jgi:REP element-mobilizing transposase RayT
VKSNKQTIAANVEGYSNAMKKEVIAKNNLGLFPETPNAVSEPLETSSAGIATELVLGVPGVSADKQGNSNAGSERTKEPNQSNGVPKGWYRRYLPHWDQPDLIQFITYRLADSLPSAILSEMENEIRLMPPERMDTERRRRIEEMLDQGYGSGILREPVAAECVMENWRHFHGQRYDLIAWVVMPTHVHVLIRMYETASLPKIVQSWKSYTGKRLKALFRSTCVNGEFWMREYWDRYIRDEKHFYATLAYIQQNPVKAGLVSTPSDWPYTGLATELVLGVLGGGVSDSGGTEHQLGEK